MADRDADLEREHQVQGPFAPKRHALTDIGDASHRPNGTWPDSRVYGNLPERSIRYLNECLACSRQRTTKIHLADIGL
jgi:hypothetical protein